MNPAAPLALLGGLSPEQFMRRYWQRKPLLIRQAVPGFRPLLSRAQLFALARLEDVESRLVVADGKGDWSLECGPFARGRLPPLRQPRWTLLVQGVDLHDDRVHGLLQQFRFVPDARLDDVMISYATDGGGVGPHFDSYDVFLLQAQGQRRWRIGRQKSRAWIEGLPVRILADFQPEEEHVLDPGDMLYLPPGWAHDGVAVGKCMTYSIGFRVPQRGDLARELLQRVADTAADALGETLYRDAGQPAVAQPGRIPAAMAEFAVDALERALADRQAVQRALGEALTEPKPAVWFEPVAFADDPQDLIGVRLDRRSRMLYDDAHVFINGESYRATGRDAALMRRLADERMLDARALRQASAAARELLGEWLAAGWCKVDTT